MLRCCVIKWGVNLRKKNTKGGKNVEMRGFCPTTAIHCAHWLCRSTAEAMVMSPPEPPKEKEKQGFFRGIKKKKKKKTQMVRK